MAERPKIIGFIPLRGGSKSIPHKNIKPIAGRPLAYWVLDAATGCRQIDRVYVSTDDREIVKVIRAYEDTRVHIVKRSPATATDQASTELAMLEFAASHDFEQIVLIQATSPLLKAQHLDAAIERFLLFRPDSLVSVVRQKRFVWQIDSTGYARPMNYDPLDRPLRQNFDGFWVENGAFYICHKQTLLSTGSRLAGKIMVYEMPDETYYELDEPIDWIIIEDLLKHRQSLNT